MNRFVLLLVTIATFALTHVASAAESHTLVMVRGFAAEPYKLDHPFKAVHVGNENLVEIVTSNDRFISSNRQVTLYAKAAGETNILFYDDQGNLIDNLHIVIRASMPHSVTILDRPAMGETTYLCSPQGCDFVHQSEIRLPTRVIDQTERMQK